MYEILGLMCWLYFFPQDIWKWVHTININTPFCVSPGVWMLDLGSRGLHPCSASALPTCSLSLELAVNLPGNPPHCRCPPAVPWVASSFVCVPGTHCTHLSHCFVLFSGTFPPTCHWEKEIFEGRGQEIISVFSSWCSVGVCLVETG